MGEYPDVYFWSEKSAFVVLEILEGREDFRQRSGIEDILMQSTDGMMEAESVEVRERVYV